ncbi:MAG: LAGLIDADG family homing endonuclease [archaeon]
MKKRKFTKWNKSKILKELINLSKKLGKSPSYEQIPKPLYQACRRLFGSMNKAKKVAGLSINKQKHHIIKKDIKKLTNELAYILGVILGDGYCYIKKSKRRTNGVIGLHVKDKDFADEFKKILYRWCLIKPKKHFGERGYIVGLYSIDCARIILNYDINKIIKSSLKKKSLFLKGLFDSEGAVIGLNLQKRQFAKRWIHFSNSNKEIIKIVEILLKDFKINFKLKSRGHSGFGSKRLQYEIIFYGKDNLKKFFKSIGFSIKRKQQLLLKILNSYNN